MLPSSSSRPPVPFDPAVGGGEDEGAATGAVLGVLAGVVGRLFGGAGRRFAVARRWCTRTVAGLGAAGGTTDELPKPFSDCSVVPFRRLGAGRPGAASCRAVSTGIWYCVPAGVPGPGSMIASCPSAGAAGPTDSAAKMRIRMDARTSDRVQAPAAGAAQFAAAPGRLREALPMIVTLLALGLADAHYGAFTIDRWGPLAVFVLVVLAIVAPGRHAPAAGRIPLALIGGFASWSLASVLWGQMPGAAYEGGARNVLLAGLFALPLLTLTTRRAARLTADLLVAVLAAIVAGTVIAYVADPGALFLAGRLENPIAYRNGNAVLFAMAFWPLVLVAASRRVPWAARPPALALATAAACLAFLTQSRGVLIGTALGAVVVLALGPERLRRALTALVAVAPVALFSHRLLQPYDTFSVKNETVPSTLTDARGALLLAALTALGAGCAIVAGDRLLRGRVRRGARVLAVLALAAVCVGAAGSAAAKVGDPAGYIRDKADEFTALQNTDSGSTRFGSVGGQRSDLWRVALKEFGEHPVAGVGEGGYPVGYYEHRRTDRNLVAAHSLPFGTLAELGLVGVLLLLAFVASSGAVIGRGARALEPGDRRRLASLAAVAVVFLGQSIVDWFWTIPGLSGLAVTALGIAIVLVAGDAPAPGAWSRVRRIVPAVVCGLLALMVATQVLSARAVDRARIAADQQVRLDRARTAARLNPFATTPEYLQAGALEALGRPDAARAKLLGVLRDQPLVFVTPALIGDLETRRGNRAAARRWYARAAARNPLDTGLRKLAAR